MSSNYNDALAQLRSFGLLVDDLIVGKRQRCRADGRGKEKCGWYHLHEIRLASGDDLIVGSFGIWTGNSNNAQKIEYRKDDLNQEQRDALKRRMAEDRKNAELAEKAAQARAAEAARKAWALYSAQGECEYLTRKGVLGHGVRYTKGGAIVVPVLDTSGQIHGLQIIRGKLTGERRKLDKEFWPSGLKKQGHFHQIGSIGPIVLVCEGYATGASLYQATGLPVVVAFDAGNIIHVARALRARYKHTRLLICADDDATQKCHAEVDAQSDKRTECRQRVWLNDGANCHHCGQPHKASNAGITAASAAALEVGGAWIVPRFTNEAARRESWLDKGTKLNDFNDLHLTDGLHAVRTQIDTRLLELGWGVQAQRASIPTRGEGSTTKDPLQPVDTVDELLDRFALVYGQGGTVFDHQEHMLLPLSDMRDACLRREIHRAWCEHPDKQIVRVQEVGFDPSETDPTIKCNLWAGWPTTPKAGKCDYLLELLHYMCAGEGEGGEDLYWWVLRWLAYPLQHPGAKMKTTLVIHGPQGTGKNKFFEAVMAIYGRYGRVIDQSAIEDKFNDWASGKLFLIADEVVARSDLYHVKNKLKAFITGEWIRINPKNRAAYDERNHVNMVFLSNEAMPVVLEEDDRRHAVIWTPEKLSQDFYAGLIHETKNGGVAALHDYLLHIDLGDFSDGTLPPMTEAKKELIHLGLDSPSRFVLAFERGDVDGFPAARAPALLTPCLAQDFFELYCEWCKKQGLKSLNAPRFGNAVRRKHKGQTERKRIGESNNPSTVLYLPGGQELPTGKRESDWLSERCAVFKTALKDYRGGASGVFNA